MNLLQELRTLDPRDPGRWPLAVRSGAVLLCFVLVSLMALYFFVWTDLNPQLQQLEDQEQQLADIEKSFGAMLRQLPSKTEVDNLLVDISQTGLAAALDQKLFQPETEVKKDFYAERPIKIRFAGSYHQFGAFVSGIAALPRIVTLHDVQITPVQRSSTGTAVFDQLQMDLTAKTYRYLDDEEVATAEADRRKSEKSAKRPTG